MPRDNSPCIIGDYWLDKRRDGISPNIWQVASYAAKSRSVVYRSTKQRDLERAKEFLRSHEADQRSTKRNQDAGEAELLPHLFHYLREHGPDVKRLDTIKSSFNAWIGFLMQDKVGMNATIAELTPTVVDRFRRWRMGPHSWEIEWADGKVYRHASLGVGGQAVQRNIEDLRSALLHGEGERRFDAPKVKSVDKKLRKRKRLPKVLDPKALGALIGYAKEDEGIYRELALMLATACRPGVAQAFDPAAQWHGDVLDLQPEDVEETDKRNAVVPVIEPIRSVLKAWKEKPHAKVKSHKRWWRTAKRVLGMDVRAYDVRHTIATMLDNTGVPGVQLSGIVGHLPSSRNIARTTSEHYLHYDPRNCPQAKRALTKFFNAVMAEAAKWNADHVRTKAEYRKPIQIVARPLELAELQEI